MLESRLRNSKHLNAKQVEAHLQIGKSLATLLSMSYFIYLVASLTNRRILPQLLASWAELEKLLTCYTWKASVTENEPQQSRFATNLTTIVGSLIVSVLFPTVAIVALNVSNGYTYRQAAVIGFTFFCIGSTEVLHDWVVILTLKELRSNYSQVQQDVNRWAGHRDRIDDIIVDTWRDLVVAIREQGSLLSKYLTGTQLPCLLQTIAVSTLCLFSSLRLLSRTGTMWGEFDDRKALVGNLTGTTYLLLRLLYKVSLAQEVTNQVRSC